MADTHRDEFTHMLNNAAPADSAELLGMVYDQLRRIAQQRMSEERRDHTLQATALVHEGWLRLAGERVVPWKNRAHFFTAAAEAMRRILVEHARTRGRLKRGGGPAGTRAKRIPIQVLDLADDSADPDEILMLNEALRRLENEDADAARVVRLRFFAGLSGDETAEALGISSAAVDREWAYARARLFRFMSER